MWNISDLLNLSILRVSQSLRLLKSLTSCKIRSIKIRLNVLSIQTIILIL